MRKNHLMVSKYLLLNDYDIEDLLTDKEVWYKVFLAQMALKSALNDLMDQIDS